MKVSEKELIKIIKESISETYLNESVNEFNPVNTVANAARKGMASLRNSTNNFGMGYNNNQRGEGRVKNNDVNYNGYGQMYQLNGKNMPDNSDATNAYNARMYGKQNPKLANIPQTYEAGAQERLKLMQDIRAKVDGYEKAGYFGDNPETLNIVQLMKGACDAGKSTASSFISKSWNQAQKKQNQRMVAEGIGDYFRKSQNKYGVKTTSVDTNRNILSRLLFPKTQGGGKWMLDLKKEIEYAITKGCWPKDSGYMQQVYNFLKILCNSYGVPIAPAVLALLPATCTGNQNAPIANNTNANVGQDTTYAMQRSRGQSDVDQNTIQQIAQTLQQDTGAYVVVTPHSSNIKQNPNYDNNALEDSNYQSVVNALKNAGISPERIKRGSDEYTGRNGFGGAEMENTNIKVIPGNSLNNKNYLNNTGGNKTATPFGAYMGQNVYNLNESMLRKIIKENIIKMLKNK